MAGEQIVSSENSAYTFVKSQYDLFVSQFEAIAQGRFEQARSAAQQLNLILPSLKKTVGQVRKGEIEVSDREKYLIEEMVTELKKRNKKSINLLQEQKSEMINLLKDLRIGRQIVSGYRSPRRDNAMLFELTG